MSAALTTVDSTTPTAASTNVTVRRIGSKDPRWDEFVGRSPGATFCHLAGWAQVVERTWRHEPHHLGAYRDGNLVGLLPLFHVRSRLFGSMLVSSPNAVYGGAIADDAEVRRLLNNRAKALARELSVQYLELRDLQASEGDAELVGRDLYVTFERAIAPDREQLARSFPRDVRRMCRLGLKHGLSASFGREELLDEFYEVYATSVRNLGTPVFPKPLFSNFLGAFPDACDILLIRHGRQVAGGVMNFYFRDTVLPYYGGAYPAFYPAGVSNFMYWELMVNAAERGYRQFDFGRSKVGTGAHAFKRGWGMQERPLPYRFFLVGATDVPNLTPANPRLTPFIRLWKTLPLPVTKLVGPLIVRGLP